MSKFRKHHTSAAKLDSMRVLAIRQKYEEGWSQGRLAREYGVSVGQIGRIVRGEAWQEYSQIGRTESEVLHEMAKQVVDEPLVSLAAKESERRFIALMAAQGTPVEVPQYDGPPPSVEDHGFISPGLLRLEEEVEKRGLDEGLASELDDFIGSKGK